MTNCTYCVAGLKPRVANRFLIHELKLVAIQLHLTLSRTLNNLSDTQFQYDANGNVILSTESNGGTQDRVLDIQYDHRNLPVNLHITDDNLDQYVYYRYNADGQRIYKKVGSQSAEHYIMDGDQNTAVFNEDGKLCYWNILAGGVAGRVDSSGARFYYIKDHLGSTRSVIDIKGNIKEALDYYPFGLLMSGRVYQSGSGTKEKFTGKELDGETNWYDLGARLYDPALGIFHKIDLLTDLAPGKTPYHYASNDPINRIDPTGRQDTTNTEVTSGVITGGSNDGPLGGASAQAGKRNEEARKKNKEDENDNESASNASNVTSMGDIVFSTASAAVGGVGTSKVKPGFWFDPIKKKWYPMKYNGRTPYTALRRDVTNSALKWGRAGNFLSHVGTGMVLLNIGANTYQFGHGNLSLGRYSFRTVAGALSIAAGYASGGYYGAAVGLSAFTVEIIYDAGNIAWNYFIESQAAFSDAVRNYGNGSGPNPFGGP